MLIMRKNSIFKQFFDSVEKYFHVQGKLALKQFPDVAQRAHGTISIWQQLLSGLNKKEKNFTQYFISA